MRCDIMEDDQLKKKFENIEDRIKELEYQVKALLKR